jgi:hypothetical protein
MNGYHPQQQHHLHHHPIITRTDVAYDGGVEEKKEEPLSPPSYRPQRIPKRFSGEEEPTMNTSTSTDDRSVRSHWERLSRFFTGSCGNALEAASLFVQGQSCRWPGDLFGNSGNNANANNNGNNNNNMDNRSDGKPQLSIAEELRLLAIKEGRYPGEPLQTERRGDIPRFLGEDAVYSFEDDDVSALSQHTLEEMARNGVVHPLCRRQHSVNSQSTPPTPSKLLSTSTSSDRDKPRLLR